MNGEESKRKGKDDTVFIKINQFITLQKEHINRNNELLNELLKKVISTMAKQDALFAELYQKMTFAGSFYKGTKVGHPEEFDLILILKLPIDYNKIKFEEDRPGYARMGVPADALLPAWKKHESTLNKWIANASNYLNNDELRKWFESVITRCFLTLEKLDDGWSKLTTDSGRIFKVKTKKSGPAFTLNVMAPNDVKFDIDLVPALEFKIKPKLIALEKIQEVDKGWYLVPKPLKTGTSPELSWRFCFYPHEKKLLSKNGKIKPVIRHLKKLRDCQNWAILASYYIETLIYNELSNNNLNLEKSSMSILLVHMLTKLRDACSNHEIPYHWDPKNNLLAERTPQQLENLVNRMNKIIPVLQTKPEGTLHYFLTAEELAELAAVDTPSSTPSEISDDSGVSSPVAEVSGVKKKLLHSLSVEENQEKTNQTSKKYNEMPNDNQSMDQIAILTKTIAALTDEIKTMKATFTEEIRDLRRSINQLTEQSNTMNESTEILVINRLRAANL